MRRRKGGSKVRGGFYWNEKKRKLVAVSRKEGNLPGSVDERFLKVPTLAVLTGAPVFGGLLVICLPFIGLAMIVGQIARKLERPSPEKKEAGWSEPL